MFCKDDKQNRRLPNQNLKRSSGSQLIFSGTNKQNDPKTFLKDSAKTLYIRIQNSNGKCSVNLKWLRNAALVEPSFNRENISILRLKRSFIRDLCYSLRFACLFLYWVLHHHLSKQFSYFLYFASKFTLHISERKRYWQGRSPKFLNATKYILEKIIAQFLKILLCPN